VDGWAVDYWSVTVANSTTQAFSGTHSLALTLTRAWSTLTFKGPALNGGLRYIGLEIENGGGTKTTPYLDAIGWGH